MQSFGWVVILLFVFACLGVMAYLVYAGDIALAHARHEARQKATLNAAVGLINNVLQSINRDLLYLACEGRLAEAIQTPDAAAMTALEHDWLAFSRSKTIYDKIRWLDRDGRERLRINYTVAGPLAVPAERISFQSSNAWDVAGAGCFGFRTVWINRSGAPAERLPAAPECRLPDLSGLPAVLGA